MPENVEKPPAVRILIVIVYRNVVKTVYIFLELLAGQDFLVLVQEVLVQKIVEEEWLQDYLLVFAPLPLQPQHKLRLQPELLRPQEHQRLQQLVLLL